MFPKIGERIQRYLVYHLIPAVSVLPFQGICQVQVRRERGAGSQWRRISTSECA
jgi:hypothetical protein